ncbi:hypothetical protein V6N12_043982 [Hibiscus sabdariffa]|uniref:Uncharacterized protein n=1 Tax=Hibiscus sabdariffa TaxID=183260 RepID=A0ABR2DGC2_9ROSI
MSQVVTPDLQPACVLPTNIHGGIHADSTPPPEHIDAFSSPSITEQPVEHELGVAITEMRVADAIRGPASLLEAA